MTVIYHGIATDVIIHAALSTPLSTVLEGTKKYMKLPFEQTRLVLDGSLHNG